MLAYALHNLARAQGNALAASKLNQLQHEMKPEQIASAQELSRRMNVAGRLLPELDRQLKSSTRRKATSKTFYAKKSLKRKR
ncbi:hypothetical protein D3C85_1257000 [compost metagenome]